MGESSCARFYGNFKTENAVRPPGSSVAAIQEETTATQSSDFFLTDINNKYSKIFFQVLHGRREIREHHCRISFYVKLDGKHDFVLELIEGLILLLEVAML
ncbi:hypothetical protein TNIN_343711 [Trichonephila inaurata madagascariensis]|uniref:Uncharacterized protein n=1 Tax=Trichonephila inaurata madagascariensis TaxID=2747483 RepID=A0A8X6X1E7_9ARAC|nr:hypothetical protein TNIN_343711 [Trichonephila inaurata madagascariensis]